MTKSGKLPASGPPSPLQKIWVGFAITCMLLLAVGAVATALGAWEVISL
ncbi:MAG: hypothetical protein WBB29_02220 [Geitlerinemataceae cyanobacterium]